MRSDGPAGQPPHRRVRRLPAVLRIGIAALALAMAWARADETPSTITAWTRAVNFYEGRILQEAVERFNRSQARVRVDVVATDVRDRDQHVHGNAASGNLPCLFEVDAPFVAAFAWPGYLLPLDRFIGPALRRDLLPSILAQGRFEGRLYMLGQFDAGLGLWANRRLLAAAGLRLPTVARPWSLAEFEHALDRLARLDGMDAPLELPLYTGAREFTSFAFLPLLAGFGADLIDRAGSGLASGTLDGPAAVDAMRRLQDWIGRGWVSATTQFDGRFERGRRALLWSGHWQFRDLERALGRDLILLPLPDFGRGLKTGIGSWGWAIASTCRDPEAAWAFLSHLMSVPEIQRMTAANGAVPARRSALAGSPLYAPGGPLALYPAQLSAGAGLPRPATPDYAVVTSTFADSFERIVQGVDVQLELTHAARTIDAARGAPVARR